MLIPLKIKENTARKIMPVDVPEATIMVPTSPLNRLRSHGSSPSMARTGLCPWLRPEMAIISTRVEPNLPEKPLLNTEIDFPHKQS